MPGLRNVWRRVVGQARPILQEVTSTIGFVLYTIFVVHLFIFVRPAVLYASGYRRYPPPERPARRRRRDPVASPDDERRARPLAKASTAARPRRQLSTLPSGSRQAQSQFLMRLPLELRQEIYRLVLGGRHKQFIRLGGDDWEHDTDFVLNNADYRTRDTFSMPPPRWVWRRSSLLAVPLTCRQVYVESMPVLYQSVVFKLSRLFTLSDLAHALLPPRFAAMRSLEIGYEFRCGLPLTRAVAIGEDADWAACWRLMATRMPGLRDLRLDLFAFDIRALCRFAEGEEGEDAVALPPPDADLPWRWLRHMLQVSGLRRCHVKLHHVKRFNDSFSASLSHGAQVNWYMLVVMDALERLISTRLVGKHLQQDPPHDFSDSDKVLGVWHTCLMLAERGSVGVEVEEGKGKEH